MMPIVTSFCPKPGVTSWAGGFGEKNGYTGLMGDLVREVGGLERTPPALRRGAGRYPGGSSEQTNR
jgi:hypothetical protein